MSRLEEIQAAIQNLPSEEYSQLAHWFCELDQARWENQLDEDSARGKLDFLFQEAEVEPGLLKPWPPKK